MYYLKGHQKSGKARQCSTGKNTCQTAPSIAQTKGKEHESEQSGYQRTTNSVCI
jgi:hypothetical protein